MEEINKNNVDNSSNELRMGKLNDEYMPKAQNIQLVGKYLKDKYYPQLSLDEINERVDKLADKGLTVDKIVELIENKQIDLLTMSMEEIESYQAPKENEERD